ncbi:MAG: hypothetical protein DVB31_13290 [Verrucomicrobia bacterium]|nr:MAG: hypothetical protein DVB31_13290 [Verrucomicrobiota bacterium]
MNTLPRPSPASPPPGTAESNRGPDGAKRGFRWGRLVFVLGLAAIGGMAWVAFDAEGAARRHGAGMAEVVCRGNLVNLGLGARIHAADNDGLFPDSWIQLTNELSTPRLLVCPVDEVHGEAESWAKVGPANITYEYLGKGGGESQTNRVLTFCPIHGHVVLFDGTLVRGRSRREPLPIHRRHGIVWSDRAEE